MHSQPAPTAQDRRHFDTDHSGIIINVVTDASRHGLVLNRQANLSNSPFNDTSPAW